MRKVAKRIRKDERTVKVSISVGRGQLKALKERAEMLYGGNVSAVIAELAEDARRLTAWDRFIEKYDIPPLTDQDRAEIRAEQERPLRPVKTTKRRKAA
jgi:hypothetical protein